MFELQNEIFHEQVSRRKLINKKQTSSNKYKVAVYRNHSFELIEHAIPLFLNFADISIDFKYSDYDDSLTFIDLDRDSDALLLWLDLSRYENEDKEEFINSRIIELTTFYKKPILFFPVGGSVLIKNPNVIQLSGANIQEKLGTDFFDLRMETNTGTKLSSKASIEIARFLGLRVFPSVLQSPLKAVVLDLDNTLYRGVLGEDGWQNLTLTPGHAALQNYIKELASKGYFICIASKNEGQDVKELFEKRKDFPLGLSQISKLCVSWDSKGDSISKILKFLNIGAKDVLFVDDNLGELATVLSSHPNINCLHAKDDAFETLEVLKNFPRMDKFKINYEDSIRKKDIQANEERERLLKSLSKEEFLRTLNMELTYGLNRNKDIDRVTELGNKTNQFICTYRRYKRAEIESLMNDPDSLIVTVSLKDKLSDSGIVGVLILKRIENNIVVDECFISCRALGRGIDENIVVYPILLAINKFQLKSVEFLFTKGERNRPAEKFLEEHLKNYINKPNKFEEIVNVDYVTTKVE